MLIYILDVIFAVFCSVTNGGYSTGIQHTNEHKQKYLHRAHPMTQILSTLYLSEFI